MSNRSLERFKLVANVFLGYFALCCILLNGNAFESLKCVGCVLLYPKDLTSCLETLVVRLMNERSHEPWQNGTTITLYFKCCPFASQTFSWYLCVICGQTVHNKQRWHQTVRFYTYLVFSLMLILAEFRSLIVYVYVYTATSGNASIINSTKVSNLQTYIFLSSS